MISFVLFAVVLARFWRKFCCPKWCLRKASSRAFVREKLCALCAFNRMLMGSDSLSCLLHGYACEPLREKEGLKYIYFENRGVI